MSQARRSANQFEAGNRRSDPSIIDVFFVLATGCVEVESGGRLSKPKQDRRLYHDRFTGLAGISLSSYVNDGAFYDLRTDTWTAI
jgi:hypothetical protein